MTFVLAWLSYAFVETPLRRLRWSLGKTAACLVLLPGLVFGSLYLAARHHDGFPGRFGTAYAQMYETLKAQENPDRKRCIHMKDYDQARMTCRLGDPDGRQTALVIGDSHASHFWNFLDVLGREAQVSLVSVTHAACLGLPDTYLKAQGAHQPYNRGCRMYNEYFYEHLARTPYDYVVLAQRWPGYLGDVLVDADGTVPSVAQSRQRLEAGLDRALALIVRSGARPVLIKSVQPTFAGFEHCLYRGFKFHQGGVDNTCLKAGDDEGMAWLEGLFQWMQAKYPTLRLVDPRSVQCANGYCLSAADGVPLYRDEQGHLSDAGSLWLGKRYGEQQGNPFR